MWRSMGHFADNPMGVHWTGIVFGWASPSASATGRRTSWSCSACSPPTLRSARMAPVIGSFFKMAVPFIVILPGLLALWCCRIPTAATCCWSAKICERAPGHGLHSYNEVLPLMLVRYCGPGLLGLGITALIAGFMSGMAGNVSAFAAVWTYDIYQPLINKKAATSTTSPWAAGRRFWAWWSHRRGLPGDARAGHHGLRAGAVQLLHRAAAGRGADGHVLEARDQGAGGFWGLLIGTLTSIGLWAWVNFDPSALRYVAFFPTPRTWREYVPRAVVVRHGHCHLSW
jgi:SSS family solute:Na+ symporter